MASNNTQQLASIVIILGDELIIESQAICMFSKPGPLVLVHGRFKVRVLSVCAWVQRDELLPKGQNNASARKLFLYGNA